MQYLDLNDIHAGMVVGQDVRDARGRLLLKADSALTASQIRLLREQCIERVPIIEVPAPDRGAAAAVGEAFDARFRLCDGRHPLIGELRRLCRERLARANGGRNDD